MNELELAAAWSAISEPGDRKAGALWRIMGPEQGLQWMLEPQAAAVPGLPEWAVLHARTHPRAVASHPAAELERMRRLGAGLLARSHPQWPQRLQLLGDGEPLALWYRGNPTMLTRTQVAIVGARASTAYGNRVARELAAELTGQGIHITSGGAYGIDAAAHQGALAVGATTAVLCGGLGNLYPKGNEPLLDRIGTEGLLISEVPPGSRPARWRFIERNRVIAALSELVVVVEAGIRSGAMATANRAGDLGIDVCAVPGPVTSAASAGCNSLIREGATLVTKTSEVLELLGRDTGQSAAAEWAQDPIEQRVWEAFPTSRLATTKKLVIDSGLSEAEVRGALVGLRLRGAAACEGEQWRRL